MKVFNPISAPKSGKVTRVFIDNETPVEYGETLAIIE
jgi:acetyl-CoA carboxylase biotin carboxyl carrier protein